MVVPEHILADQVAYYRRRAREYDETAYGDPTQAQDRIARLVAAMEPRGDVLEIACGTGLWTQALAQEADSLTAIDAAPEAVAIACERVSTNNVSFQVADVYSWSTERRFDVVFFSAWLSHVPTDRFDQFWQLLRGLVTDGGRVLFVDEHVDARGKETYISDQGETVERSLRDGSIFRIIKNFVDPEELRALLARIGWQCTVRRDGRDWVVGEARPRARIG